jgi:hypothetical protein
MRAHISNDVALREHAERWLLAASGTMDSHLHAVSGVSSCSQRSQAESTKRAWNLRFAGETRRNNKKGGYWDTKTIRRVTTCLAGPKPVLSTGGRGIAYCRDRTPPAYTRSEIGRLAKRMRGQRELVRTNKISPVKTDWI